MEKKLKKNALMISCWMPRNILIFRLWINSRRRFKSTEWYLISYHFRYLPISKISLIHIVFLPRWRCTACCCQFGSQLSSSVSSSVSLVSSPGSTSVSCLWTRPNSGRIRGRLLLLPSLGSFCVSLVSSPASTSASCPSTRLNSGRIRGRLLL